MLTIQSWLEGVGRKRRPPEECPHWPPDLYAIAGGLLKRSGAYLRVFDRIARSESYLDGIDAIGDAWRARIEGLPKRVTIPALLSARPKGVLQLWKRLIAHKETKISEVRDSKSLSEDLIRMTLIADEACAGIGIDWDLEPSDQSASRRSIFLSLADTALSSNKNRSFCWDLSVDVICVLAKQHTPQLGATFRSLSHHLALYLPTDITARWMNPYPRAESPLAQKSLNLLLLPWPIRIKADDFSEVHRVRRETDVTATSSYFRFDPEEHESTAQFRKRLRRTLEHARRESGKIDAIIFPELALTETQYYEAERVAFDERAILIAGLREKRAGLYDWDLNWCAVQPAGMLRETNDRYRRNDRLIESLRLRQPKHHRWRLTHEQIISYQLSGRLPVQSDCWENAELLPRIMHFVTLNHMTWSVLVCEDLARQDPAADLIRAVGPNLLIALLMDGPQLKARWPGRYAGVLAEDPGTSVLTLTSLGMSVRSRPINSGKRMEISRVIALWNDAEEGEVEISLDEGDDACVLTLECRKVTEYRADGRGDGSETRCPVFAGFKSFRTEP